MEQKLANFTFNLNPKDAINYFSKKTPILEKELDKIAAANKAKAFHIANIDALNILQKIKKELESSLKDGTTFEQFKDNLQEKIDLKNFSTGRLNTIFRSNINSAYSAGRFKSLKANSLNRPYWQYHAILDDRVRDNHAGVHGKVFRHDDAFWTHFYPPNGFNCRCSVVALSEKDIQRRGLKVENTQESEFIATPRDLTKPEQKTFAYIKRDEKGQIIGQIKPDASFDYPAQLYLYSPKLDYYDIDLANLYIKRELNGATFAFVYNDIKENLAKLPELKELKGKERNKFFDNKENQIAIRNNLKIQANFAVGLIDENIKQAFGAKTNIVLFSDDNLIKNIFKHDEAGIMLYQMIPALLKKISSDNIYMDYKNKKPHPTVKLTFEGKKYNLGFKVANNQLFLLSIRRD